MAHDEELATRIRRVIGDRPDLAEKRMFGGLAWLVGGNMAVAAMSTGGLMVRVDPTAHDAMLEEPGVEPMVMRGKEIRGWISVAPKACTRPSALAAWIRRGLEYALTLPPK